MAGMTEAELGLVEIAVPWKWRREHVVSPLKVVRDVETVGVMAKAGFDMIGNVVK